MFNRDRHPGMSEADLRWVLWDKCPHGGKYGDDGQLQCRGADFSHDSIDSLLDHLMNAAAAAATHA